MRVKDEYVHGAHNKLCDRTGFKVKSTATMPEWTGSIVRWQDWEPRHPQDFVRGVRDLQAVSDPRPGSSSHTASETSLDADELPGQTVISVASTTGVTIGDSVIVFLDDGTHLSTISSFSAGDTITLSDAIPSKASSGNKVVYMSSQVQESDL